MKIIMIDNYDRETIDDVLIAENISNFYASCVVEALNAKYSGDRSPYYFALVKDNHKLHKFEP